MGGFIAVALSIVVLSTASGESTSIENALREVSIGGCDRPELSADGRYLTYSTVDHPPVRSYTSQYGGGVTSFLPDGMLSYKKGAHLHVTAIAAAATVDVGTADSSSWSAAFSPDGRNIAFLSDAQGASQIWVADVATGISRRVSDAPVFVKFGNELDRPVWSKDGSAIYALIVEEASPLAAGPEAEGPLSQPTVIVKTSGTERSAVASSGEAQQVASGLSGRLSAGTRMRRAAIERIEVQSGQRHVLVAISGKAQPYAYQLSPSQQWIAYVTAESIEDSVHELFVARVAGGGSQSLGKVVRNQYDAPDCSQLYSSIFHWSPRLDRLTLVQDEKLKVADFTSGRFTSVYELAGELGRLSLPYLQGGVDWFDQVALTVDGKAAIARLVSPDDLAFAIVPLDGSPAHQIKVSPEATRNLRFLGLVYGDLAVLWQPSPDSFVLFGSDLTTGARLLLRISMTDGAATVLTEEDSAFVFHTSVSADSIVGTYTNAITPPNLYQFDSTFKKRRRLTHVQPELDGLPIGSRIIFTTRVPSFDGTMKTLKTGILLPASYRKGRAPPALVHIYPTAEMSKQAAQFGGGRLGCGELAQFWLSRGYAVIFPDLLPLLPIGDVQANPIREVRDYLLPQIQHAVDLGYVDVDRVVLTGMSYGGYGTLAVISDTNLFRAAVAYSSGTPDINPLARFKQYLTNSPYLQADKVRTPLLLIHGTRDNWPALTSELMFQGLESLGRTAQLALYEGEPHGPSLFSGRNAVDVLQRVQDFVARYAPPDRAAGQAHDANAHSGATRAPR